MDIVSAFCCIGMMFINYVGCTLLRDRDSCYYKFYYILSVFVDFACVVELVHLDLDLGLVDTLVFLIIYILSCSLFYSWYDKSFLYKERCEVMYYLIDKFTHSINLLENNIDTDKSKNSHLLRNPLVLDRFKEVKSALLDSLDKLFSCDVLRSRKSYDSISATVISLIFITDSMLDNLVSDYNEDRLVDEFTLYTVLMMISDVLIGIDMGEIVDDDLLDGLISESNELSNLFAEKYKDSEEV